MIVCLRTAKRKYTKELHLNYAVLMWVFRSLMLSTKGKTSVGYDSFFLREFECIWDIDRVRRFTRELSTGCKLRLHVKLLVVSSLDYF